MIVVALPLSADHDSEERETNTNKQSEIYIHNTHSEESHKPNRLKNIHKIKITNKGAKTTNKHKKP